MRPWKTSLFQVAQGEIVGIIRPNGSGKSTLMKSAMGLVKPWRGTVSVLGQPSQSQRRLVGYMPQMEHVDWDFPVTVSDVALMGRYSLRGLLRRPTRGDRETADLALERVGMYPLRQRLIGELSAASAGGCCWLGLWPTIHSSYFWTSP